MLFLPRFFPDFRDILHGWTSLTFPCITKTLPRWIENLSFLRIKFLAIYAMHESYDSLPSRRVFLRDTRLRPIYLFVV